MSVNIYENLQDTCKVVLIKSKRRGISKAFAYLAMPDHVSKELIKWYKKCSNYENIYIRFDVFCECFITNVRVNS